MLARRALAAATAGLLTLTIALLSAPALADSVSDAEDEARQARAAAEQAKLAASAAESHRSTVESALLQALDEHQITTNEMSLVGRRMDRLADDIFAAEARIRELRAGLQEKAVRAYMRAVMTGAPVWLSGETFTDAVILTETVASAGQDDIGQMDQLAVSRNQLDEILITFESEQVRLGTIQESLASQAAELDALFAQASADVRTAYDTVSRTAAELADARKALDRERFLATSTTTTTAPPNTAPPTTGGTPPTTTPPPVPGGPFIPNVERWRDLVSYYFPSAYVEAALAVMQCESRGNPDAYNRYSGASGLFQFIPSTWAVASTRAGFAGSSAFDAEANIAAAAWLVQYNIARNHSRGPFGSWTCRSAAGY